MARHTVATLLAARCNPLIQAQYQELLRKGKVKPVEAKVALTACMRRNLGGRHDARQGPVQAEGYRLRRTGFSIKGGFALDFQDSCCTLCWAAFD